MLLCFRLIEYIYIGYMPKSNPKQQYINVILSNVTTKRTNNKRNKNKSKN